MQVFFNILGFKIPSYGILIVTGVILANVLAIVYIRKTKKHDINDFIILEAYAVLGGFLGAKILYLIVSYKSIEWSRLFEIEYFNALMQGGFVFYGGLIGGIACVLLGGKIHNIKSMEYMRDFIGFIPFIHSFGRVGCFMSGCCYGIPYSGIGAVKFPADSYAPSDIELFPVQLVEACLLMIIAGIILYLVLVKNNTHGINMYLILYGCTRFILEFLRYDDARGGLLGLSTSQWISLLIIAGVVLYTRITAIKNINKEAEHVL